MVGVLRKPSFAWLLLVILAVFALTGCYQRDESHKETKKIDDAANTLSKIIKAEGPGFKRYMLFTKDTKAMTRLENAKSLSEWRTILRFVRTPDESKIELDEWVKKRQEDESKKLQERTEVYEKTDTLAQQLKNVSGAHGWQAEYLSKLKAVNSLLSKRRLLLYKNSRLVSEYWVRQSEYEHALGVLRWQISRNIKLKDPKKIRVFADKEILPRARQAQNKVPKIKRLRTRIERHNLRIKKSLNQAEDYYAKNGKYANPLSTFFIPF